jgi:rubrerythrin
LTEREGKLFEILRTAMEREREAQAMYTEAIALCDDAVLKAVLEGFHADEKRHEREVTARYHQFRSDFSAEG